MQPSVNFNPFRILSNLLSSAMERKKTREVSIAGSRAEQMTIVEHIQDLRKHVIKSMLWLLGFTTLAIVFMQPLLRFLKLPYDHYLANVVSKTTSQELFSISVFEVMTVNFKVCLLIGLVLSLPLIIFEIWKFVLPALYESEKKIAMLILFSSILLFYLGLSSGFFLIIPYFFSNALNWASQYATVMITYENYFNTLITMMLIFSAVFEVPVVLSLLGLAGIVPSSILIKNRKIVFLSSFIIGAILAPPDVLALCLVSLPIYFMVEVSILILKKIEKSHQFTQNNH